MIGTSWRIKDAIDGFAKAIGVEARAASDGSYNFTLSRSGELSFTTSDSGDRLLVALSWRERGLEGEALWRLLSAAGYDASLSKMVHGAASAEGDLLHMVEFNENEIDPSSLDAAVRRLMEIRNAR